MSAYDLKTTLSPQSAARLMIQNLVSNGITHFFGVPGGPSAPIFEAIRVTEGLTFIESRQESNALFAAASYYRSTGHMAAVVITAGPGATNAASGFISAHLERIPLLLITGDVPWATTGGIMAQDSGPDGAAIDHMYAHTARSVERIYNSASAVSQCVSAVNAALDEANPGPSIVILPIDKAMQQASQEFIPIHRRKLQFELGEDISRQIIQLLSESKRPLVVLGGATKDHADIVLAFIEKFKLPFLTTPRAKGTISEKHPQSLRNGGVGASHWAKQYTSAGVDLCIALGTDLDDSSMGPTPCIAKNGKLIHVDINPRVFNRNVVATKSIHCDLRTFCLALINSMESISLPNMKEELEAIKKTSPFDLPDHETIDGAMVSPSRAIADLAKALPQRRRIITDVGGHMLMAFHYFTVQDHREFNIHFNLGCMGSGITGAIGLAVADKSSPVLCVCGDGGMQMNGMEVLVAQKEKLPIIYAVFNDGRYNIVHHGMKQIFGNAHPWDTPMIDFKAWALSMGIRGATINKGGDITIAGLAELTDNFSLPCVLDIRIDPEEKIKGGGRAEVLQLSMLADKKN